MITDDGENQHHLAVKELSALLRGTTSNHNGDFYCLNYFHSYRTKKTFKKHEKVCEDHDSYCVKMPDENEKILKYNPGEKSLKVPLIIYLLGKIDTCQNDPKKSSAEKKAERMPSGYSWITCCSLDKSKNEWGYYRGKNCIEMFCKDLRNQAMKIINYEKKEMIPLTNEETESYVKQKVCYVCEK